MKKLKEHGRYFLKYLFSNKLTLVHVELTNVCNSKCLFCVHPLMKRPVGMMQLSLFNKVTRECEDMGVEKLALHFYGESTLHPNFLEFLNHASRFKPSLEFDTNAICLTPPLIREVLKTNLDNIAVSFHALTRNDFKTFYGIDAFDIVVKNVKYLIAHREEMGSETKILIQTAYSEITKGKFDALPSMFGNSVEYVELKCYYFPGTVDVRVEKTPILERTSPCVYLTNHLAVLWDGRVTVCCSDYDGILNVGNANTETLREIWAGKAHRDLQKKHFYGKYKEIPLCKFCQE